MSGKVKENHFGRKLASLFSIDDEVNIDSKEIFHSSRLFSFLVNIDTILSTENFQQNTVEIESTGIFSCIEGLLVLELRISIVAKV